MRLSSSFSLRFLSVMLILNLSWAPILVQRAAGQSPLPGPQLYATPTPQYVCYGTGVPAAAAAQMIAIQQPLFEHLGWQGYELCEDFSLPLMQEVVGPTVNPYDPGDPNNYVLFGTRGDSTVFQFTVEHVTHMDAWEQYGLPADELTDLQETNATASMIDGVINGSARFTAFAFSLDDPSGNLGRIHQFIVLDWQPVILQQDYGCDTNDAASYQECLDLAWINYMTCRLNAQVSYNACVSTAGAGLISAELLTCIIAALGGVSIVGTVVVCGITIVVSLLSAILACRAYRGGQLQICENDHKRDRARCRRQYCSIGPSLSGSGG